MAISSMSVSSFMSIMAESNPPDSLSVAEGESDALSYPLIKSAPFSHRA